jgi:hypothetical protein
VELTKRVSSLSSILPQNRKVYKKVKYIGSFENRGKKLLKLLIASAYYVHIPFFIVLLTSIIFFHHQKKKITDS